MTAVVFEQSGSGKGLSTDSPAQLAVNLAIAQRWQKILSFELDDLQADEPFSFVLREEMQWDEDFTILALQEYKRFMLLSSLFPSLMTPSVHVDTVWHLHLLYTRSYHRFCKEALDCEFIHHEPSKGGEQQESYFKGLFKGTLEKYEEVFGEAPPVEIWGRRV